MIYDARPGTALVVDDDDGMRAVLRNILEMEGWTVVEAEDGSVAMDVYAEHHPDLVFTDLRMPGMRGEELARRLREEAAEAGPIVAITRHPPTEDLRGLFDAVLAKPVPLGELRTWLRADPDSTLPEGPETG